MPKQPTAKELQEYPIAASSRKVYLCFLARLDTWLKGRPINDETLAEYVGYLFENGKAPPLAKSILAAVRWRSLSEDKPDPRGRRCRGHNEANVDGVAGGSRVDAGRLEGKHTPFRHGCGRVHGLSSASES